jgi:hypothetical protein
MAEAVCRCRVGCRRDRRGRRPGRRRVGIRLRLSRPAMSVAHYRNAPGIAGPHFRFAGKRRGYGDVTGGWSRALRTRGRDRGDRRAPVPLPAPERPRPGQVGVSLRDTHHTQSASEPTEQIGRGQCPSTGPRHLAVPATPTYPMSRLRDQAPSASPDDHQGLCPAYPPKNAISGSQQDDWSDHRSRAGSPRCRRRLPRARPSDPSGTATIAALPHCRL